MAIFNIRITNSTFETADEYDMVNIESAKKEAMSGALHIGVEHILSGESFFGAEVEIAQDREVVGRFVVSLGTSPLR